MLDNKYNIIKLATIKRHGMVFEIWGTSTMDIFIGRHTQQYRQTPSAKGFTVDKRKGLRWLWG